MEGLLGSLKDNQYFGAGFGLLGVGTVLAVSRKLSLYSFVAFRRYCLSTLEVTNEDPSYFWLQSYLVKRNKFLHVSLSTQFVHSGTEFDFIPATGVHYFWFRGHPVKVERSRENRAVGGTFETVTLTKLGSGSSLFTDMLSLARQEGMRARAGMTVIYTPMASWQQFGHPRLPRSLESVVLGGSLKETVLRDLLSFTTRSEWYRCRGIPYRRGYLLHGPPGCGKTSFVMALAGRLGYDLCLLSSVSSDDRLVHLLSSAPLNSIILIEDVDSFLEPRHSLTLSGLLNALDGIMSSEGRIIFMTTNHLDRLDRALIRPGRVDLSVEIGYCDLQQVVSLFSRFYPDCPPSAASQFAHSLLSSHPNVSPAHVQGIFLSNKDDYRSAINSISH